MNEQEQETLMLLRLQLYATMQHAKGDALREFWELLDEIQQSRELFPPPMKEPDAV